MVVLCYYPIYCVRVGLDMFETDIEFRANVFLTDESDSIDSALRLMSSKAVKTTIHDNETITISMREGTDYYLTFFIQKRRCPKYHPVFFEMVQEMIQNTLIQNGGIEEE